MKQSLVTPEHKRFYLQEGYVVIDQAFSDKEIEKIKMIYGEIWTDMINQGEIKQGKNEALVSIFPNQYQMHLRYNSIKKLTLNERLFDIAEAILNDDVLVVSTTCFYKSPGWPEMRPHQDDYGFGALGDSCALWMSIDNSDEENGGLFFIPKSHKLGPVNISSNVGLDGNTPDNYQVKKLNLKPGDIVVIHPYVIHGSYANTSKKDFRRSFFSFFTQEKVDKIFVCYDHLMNKSGEIVTRKQNKKHINKRITLDNSPVSI